MIIAGFQKLTLVDYPGKVAALVFTRGCNFRCSFCQNSLLLDNTLSDQISIDEVFEYLEKRKKLIDGVVITGGEPLLQNDLIAFIKKIKSLGYLVKLDTNGSMPKKLKQLLDLQLVDYIAMDIKHVFKKYNDITKVNVDIDDIKLSIELIKNSGIDHEFRTTVVKEFHDINDIENICEYIGKTEKYFLQNFENSEYVIDRSLNGFSRDELNEIKKKLNEKYPNLSIRGI